MRKNPFYHARLIGIFIAVFNCGWAIVNGVCHGMTLFSAGSFACLCFSSVMAGYLIAQHGAWQEVRRLRAMSDALHVMTLRMEHRMRQRGAL